MNLALVMPATLAQLLSICDGATHFHSQATCFCFATWPFPGSESHCCRAEKQWWPDHSHGHLSLLLKIQSYCSCAQAWFQNQESAAPTMHSSRHAADCCSQNRHEFAGTTPSRQCSTGQYLGYRTECWHRRYLLCVQPPGCGAQFDWRAQHPSTAG